MSLSSAGFHGNTQLSLPSAHNIAGMYWMRPQHWITFCRFHLVSEGPEEEQILCLSLCMKLSFMTYVVFLALTHEYVCM